MRVLMLAPFVPYPLISGGHTRVYNLLKALAREHDITLFCLAKNDSERQHLGELERLGVNVRAFRRPARPWTPGAILRTGFSTYPFVVIRNWSSEQADAVRRELTATRYDVIHAEKFYVMPHLPPAAAPLVLVEQTVEYLAYKHYVERRAPLPFKPLLWVDVAKIRYWETACWRRATRVVAMSDDDRQVMQQMAPGLSVDLVPNGIDADYFTMREPGAPGSPTLLFVGNFSWLQNREAVDTLVRRVWPRVRHTLPNARLRIAGMEMPPQIHALAGDGVTVTEGAPDIRAVYHSADVLVAPIEGPGGTRLKILEAMAAGLPVVTTSVGAAGLDVEPERHLVMQDSEAGLADGAVRVLSDPAFARRLATAARALVVERYAWGAQARLLSEVYRQAAQPRA